MLVIVSLIPKQKLIKDSIIRFKDGEEYIAGFDCIVEEPGIVVADMDITNIEAERRLEKESSFDIYNGEVIIGYGRLL